jgi:hypothetical protein
MKLDVVQSGEIFQPGTVLTWQASRGGPDMFIWQELDIYMQGRWGGRRSSSTAPWVGR